MNKFVIFTALMMATGSVLATADIFSVLDVNQDEMISIEEANIDVTLSAIFADLDTDHDGLLSKSEFTALEVR